MGIRDKQQQKNPKECNNISRSKQRLINSTFFDVYKTNFFVCNLHKVIQK